MNTASSAHFDQQYQLHLKHLKLKGLQPKTIDAYARAIRRLGGYFSGQIDALSEAQLTEYFSDLIGTHSWSAVKLDLYGLALKVGDVDAARMRVQIRDAKGNRDRFVPLPEATLTALRQFWQLHRHPELLFPNRHGGLSAAHRARTPLDRGGVQTTLRQVAQDCGLKKRSPRTV